MAHSLIGHMAFSSRSRTMIIEWDATDEHLSAVNKDALTAAASELARAHRLGSHLAIISRSVVHWLLREIQFSQIDRTTLERISSEFTQTGGLRGRASVYVKLITTKRDVPVRNGRFIEVGLHHISEPSICDVSFLIVENSINDGRLYYRLFNQLSRRLFSYPIRYQLMHGGGETINDIVDQNAESRRIISVVLDSDRRQPTDAAPAKCTRALEKAADPNFPFITVTCLPCHELENLVPPAVIGMLACGQGDTAQIARLEKISNFEQRTNVPVLERFLLFFDLKEGARKTEVEWVKAKMAVGGKGSYRGFGNNIVSQLVDNERAMAEFLKQISRQSWWDIFGLHFEPTLWAGVGTHRYYA